MVSGSLIVHWQDLIEAFGLHEFVEDLLIVLVWEVLWLGLGGHLGELTWGTVVEVRGVASAGKYLSFTFLVWVSSASSSWRSISFADALRVWIMRARDATGREDGVVLEGLDYLLVVQDLLLQPSQFFAVLSLLGLHFIFKYLLLILIGLFILTHLLIVLFNLFL